MRVVLDTNILTRAASPSRGPARRLLDLLTSEPQVLVLSPFLVSELSRVLRYDRVRAVHGLDDAGIDAYLASVERAGILVDPSPKGSDSIVASDPDDDAIVRTAIAGSADVLCTLDRHLRQPSVVEYCLRRGVRVLTDSQLLRELDALKPPEK